jgi:hypothetical protein
VPLTHYTTEKENDMRARITKLLLGLTAVAALAVGGSSLASASSKSSPAPAPAFTAVNGSVQQGDQSAPDTASAADAESTTEQSPASEQAGESTSEVAGNDGPGGHADEPGNPTADHQFDGQE